MREVLLLLGIGLVVGVPAALALGGYLSSQLYGIQPRDPIVAVTMVALLSTASSSRPGSFRRCARAGSIRLGRSGTSSTRLDSGRGYNASCHACDE